MYGYPSVLHTGVIGDIHHLPLRLISEVALRDSINLASTLQTVKRILTGRMMGFLLEKHGEQIYIGAVAIDSQAIENIIVRGSVVDDLHVLLSQERELDGSIGYTARRFGIAFREARTHPKTLGVTCEHHDGFSLRLEDPHKLLSLPPPMTCHLDETVISRFRGNSGGCCIKATSRIAVRWAIEENRSHMTLQREPLVPVR